MLSRGMLVAGVVATSLVIIGAGCGSANTNRSRSTRAGRPDTTRANQEAIELTRIGRAAAGATSLRGRDFADRNWVGGQLSPPPDPHEDLPCSASARFAPRESDITVTGFAESELRLEDITVDDSVQVVRTERMAQQGWKRWAQPAFLGCLLAEIRSPGITITSLRRLPLKAAGSFTAAYRAIDGDPRMGNWQTLEDTILIASGCARLRITITTIVREEHIVRELEQWIPELLARRATTTCVGAA